MLQGRLLEGSAFRMAPYIPRPPRPSRLETPHPSDNIINHQVSSTQVSTTSQEQIENVRSQLLLNYLLSKNRYPAPPTWPAGTSPQSWQQNQAENLSTRYPLLTQLLDREELLRRNQQATFTVTSEKGTQQQYDARWNKVTPETNQDETRQTIQPEKSSALIDMRNYPGNPLWKQFELNRMQRHQQQQQNWTNDINNKQNPPEQNWNSDTSTSNSQENYGYTPPSIASTTNNPQQPQATNYSINPSNVGDPTNDSPWFSNNNWIPSQSLPSYCYSSPLTSSNTLEVAKPVDINNVVLQDVDNVINNQVALHDDGPVIPDDIDQQFDEAVAAQWGKDMPQLDENFLNSILNPTKVSVLACVLCLSGNLSVVVYENFLNKILKL